MLIVIYFGEKVNRYRGKKRTFYENLRKTSELDGVSSSALWGDVRFTYRDLVERKSFVRLLLRGGRTRECSRAHPLVNHLPDFDARLESCACRGRRAQCTANYQCIIASKRRGVHGMYGEISSRRTLMRFNFCQASAAEIIAAPPALK